MSAGGEVAGRAPFRERYRAALANVDVRRGLVPFQQSWRAVRDAQVAEAEAIAGASFGVLRGELAAAKDAVRADPAAHLARFRAAAEAAGAVVYEASDAADACAYIERLCHERGVALVVKGKSMVSEELLLNEQLERAGVRCVESDLGEWLLQLAGDRPSHLVMPAIHLRRSTAAALLSRATGEPLDPDDIPAMVRAARGGLRDAFLHAGAGLTGANALIAESGSAVIVSNEGNGRLVSALPRLHIVTASVDKLVPGFDDAVHLIRLLARSATGQPITTYTSFVGGPLPGHELHYVLVDNGRSAMARELDVAEALRCVRCGACANVCPAYAMVGGHAFGHVYSGPIGLVTTAFHHGLEAAAGPQSLCLSCGACAEVCPVAIPLPEQILAVRRRVVEAGRGPHWQRLALRAFGSRRAVAVAAALCGLALLPFRRGRFTRLPWLPARLRWRTPPAIPLRPARRRAALRAIPLRPSRRRGTRSAPRVPLAPAAAAGGRRASLLLQCVADRLLPEIDVASARLLRAAGVQVDVPASQHCCGLVAFDAGDWAAARRMARATIEAFEGTGDAGDTGDALTDVVTPAPSCAAAIRHDYERLFADDPAWLERARRLAGRVQDLASYLDGPARLPAGSLTGGAPGAVAVHRFCQSATRLGAGDRVERLLRDLCGVETRPVAGGACCGFGGLTSLGAPELSALVLERKLDAAEETGASVLVTDNPGCLLQLRGGVDASGLSLRVQHLAEYLAERLPGASGAAGAARVDRIAPER
ncbi:MAG: 4Fe-4S dicluster domain-containing protein [Dehalococcoidia bacterium]|nr:4Fe-4S dicluster domain-containing protein [Dehalococcoidia bacterium]